MGNQYSWQRSRKYDEYDNVGSGLYRQWICYIFHCVFFCMLHSFSERKIACTDKKSIFRIYSETKSRGIPENLFSDLSDICKFSYGAVCRSCDSRKYVCRYTQYFKNAICTFDRNFNCIYCIDSDLWSFYRMCSGLLFDFYGKS